MYKEEENKDQLHGKYLTNKDYENIYKIVVFLFVLFLFFWLYKFKNIGSKKLTDVFDKNAKLGGLLASERTYLAYARTTASFIGLGLAFYKMFDNEIMKIISLMMLIFATSIIIYGNINYMTGVNSVINSKGFVNNNLPMFIGTAFLVICIMLILYATNEERISSILDYYKKEQDDSLVALQIDQVTSL